MDYWVNQIEPVLGKEEERAVAEYMRSGAWLTEFKRTEEFEGLLSEYLGVRHCVTFNNCTAALFASMAVLGIGSGDEVIIPDYTFIATATAVSWTGAKPVLVDVADNLCLDLKLAEQAITPRTKAMIVVSLNGRAPNMREAQRICDDYGLWMIEDAAQALGSRWEGKPLGTFGAIGCISFSAIKIITTGQGGLLVTNNDWMARKARALKNFGRPTAGANVYESVGYNFKFTDLQAVIGIEQFKKLAHRISHKKAIYATYYNELAYIDKIVFIDTDLAYNVTPWLVDIMVPDRDELKRFLAARGIHTRPMYPAIHTQQPYRMYKQFPRSQYAGEHGLWLPSSSNLNALAIERICAEIRGFYEN